jgi:GDP-L-fucose synthase
MYPKSKIFIAGHKGMVGSAIFRKLNEKGYSNVVARSHGELDLTNQTAVADFFEKERPEYVFLAAARVGGIAANNTYRAQFIQENLMIQNNIIHQSYLNGVKKLLFLGSSCIYPKMAPQPIKEEYLLTGSLEYTNEPYAIAKIAGIKLCEAYHDQYGCDFLPVMPTNLYGPNDNYDLERSHVLPALIRKIHLGRCLERGDINSIRHDLDLRPVLGVNGGAADKELNDVLAQFGIMKEKSGQILVTLWGSGIPKREFLHVDDLAGAVVFLMENFHSADLRYEVRDLYGHTEQVFSHLNVGCGEDLSIRDLAYLVRKIIGFDGELRFDPSKPDGTPRKLLDVGKLFSMGWRPSISLEQGIAKVYEDYCST